MLNAIFMIYIGADHGGFKLKEKVKEWLSEWGYEYQDLGNRSYDKHDDYPQYAIAVAEKVAHDEGAGKVYPQPWKDRSKGILICRSSAGMVIAANKVKGAKAVSIFDEQAAIHSREHNDTNIIAISGDNINKEQVKKILEVWLQTEFSGEERHKRRIKQIEEYEGSSQG